MPKGKSMGRRKGLGQDLPTLVGRRRRRKRKCVRFKRTSAGRRCAKYSSSGLGRSSLGKSSGLGGRKRKCVRFKRTSAGRRCAKYSKKR
jgi:hypothetical protein